MVEETIVVEVHAAVVELRVRIKAKLLHKNLMRAANDGAVGVSPWPPSALPVIAGPAPVNPATRGAVAPPPMFMDPSRRASSRARTNTVAKTSESSASGDTRAKSSTTGSVRAQGASRSDAALDPENDVHLGLFSQPRLP